MSAPIVNSSVSSLKQLLLVEFTQIKSSTNQLFKTKNKKTFLSIELLWVKCAFSEHKLLVHLVYIAKVKVSKEGGEPGTPPRKRKKLHSKTQKRDRTSFLTEEEERNSKSLKKHSKMEENGKVDREEEENKEESGGPFSIKRTEYIRLIIQAVHELGFTYLSSSQ